MEELIGRPVLEVLPGADKSDFADVLLEARNRGGSAHLEAVYPASGRWYEVSVSAIGDGITIFFRDTTKRVRIKAALRQARADCRKERQAVLVDGKVAGLIGVARDITERARVHQLQIANAERRTP